MEIHDLKHDGAGTADDVIADGGPVKSRSPRQPAWSIFRCEEMLQARALAALEIKT
jgi:hypothetical protein